MRFTAIPRRDQCLANNYIILVKWIISVGLCGSFWGPRGERGLRAPAWLHSHLQPGYSDLRFCSLIGFSAQLGKVFAFNVLGEKKQIGSLDGPHASGLW